MSRVRWIAVFAALCLLISFHVSAADTPTPPPSPTPETTTYRIQTGDTLSLIASRYHTTIGALMRLNNLSNPQLVVIGQTLLVPKTTSSAASTESSPVATSIPAPASNGTAASTAETTPAVELTVAAQVV